MGDRALLILGASSEVGLKLIEKVNNDYSLIYAHYGHNAEDLNELKNSLGDKLILIEDDLTQGDAGRAVLDKINEVGVIPEHIVLLPAPRVINERFTKISWNVYEENILVGLKSSVTILRDIIQKLCKAKQSGKVVFMLTEYVCDAMPPKFMAPYITVKYALMGLMKSLSVEFFDKKIMVNAVSPSMMETKFLDNIFDHVIEENAAKSPTGRNLTVEEVIPSFEFLLSEAANEISGRNIVVRCGQ